MAEFQMSERHSYRLLDFVEIKNVLTDQLVSPKSESQVGALVKLDPEQQSVVWESAGEIAEGNQPTAKQVYGAYLDHVASLCREEADQEAVAEIADGEQPTA